MDTYRTKDILLLLSIYSAYALIYAGFFAPYILTILFHESPFGPVGFYARIGLLGAGLVMYLVHWLLIKLEELKNPDSAGFWDGA